jgi:hypothetical protein
MHKIPPFSVSVIVPNRNDGKYLQRCLNSVIQQSVPPLELIILDDESTDNSIEVIDAAIRGCDFAKFYINPKNLGATENSNRGLSLAKGKYVFFLGANDFVLPGLFARAQECLNRYPAGIWSGMVWVVDEQDKFIRVHPSPVISLKDKYFSPQKCRNMMSSIGNWMTGQTTIYLREALVEVGGFDPSLKALTDLMSAQVVASRYGASFSPSPLGVMRIHEGAFLTATLGDISLLNSILLDIKKRGPIKEPALFTLKMLNRTTLRFYFASLRMTRGSTLVAINKEIGPLRGGLLILTRFISNAVPFLRTGLFFIVMRPFDITSTIKLRIIFPIIVRLNEYFSGKKPFRN